MGHRIATEDAAEDSAVVPVVSASHVTSIGREAADARGRRRVEERLEPRPRRRPRRGLRSQQVRAERARARAQAGPKPPPAKPPAKPLANARQKGRAGQQPLMAAGAGKAPLSNEKHGN